MGFSCIESFDAPDEARFANRFTVKIFALGRNSKSNT